MVHDHAGLGVLVIVAACTSSVDVDRRDAGAGVGGGAAVDASSGAAGATATSSGDGGKTNSSTAGTGGGGGCGGDPPCITATCGGRLFDCGDCIDNDGDGLVDMASPYCTGPCDLTEGSFYAPFPGDDPDPCKADCSYDGNGSPGNDHCQSSLGCDPLQPVVSCPADPNAPQCAEQTMQPSGCLTSCGPLNPNGCDCFGCCELPAESGNFVWLQSASAAAECPIDQALNPAVCHPCTPNLSCMNACDHCELCLGKQALPPDCAAQSCSNGAQRCGLPCDATCPSGQFCLTGCCANDP